MNILVFGANGKVGSLVVAELLNLECEVRAFVRGEHNLPSSSNLKIIHGDVKNINDVHGALKDTDIVISCLGSWGTKTKDILSMGMNNIVPAMQELGCPRIISLTGSEARLPGEKPSIIQRITHPLFKILARKILQDGEEHLRILQESCLNWTVLRSPVMNNVGKPGKSQLKNKYPLPFRTINRKSVAMALVNQIEDKAFLKQAPFIYRA
jgi:putative NADH-flavin reductase